MFAAPAPPSWRRDDVGWLDHFPAEQFRAVWQLVRDPLQVIPMRITSGRNQMRMYHQKFDQRVSGLIDPLDQAALQWVSWNEICEDRLLEARQANKMARRIQVEDEFWPQELVVTLGLEWNEQIRERVKAVPKIEPASEPMTWEQVEGKLPINIWRQVLEMAERYHYRRPADG